MAIEIRTLYKRPEIPKKKVTYTELVIISILMVTEIVINTFLPFLAGFYFAYTKSLVWLLLFNLLIIFNLKVTLKNSDIKVSILRRI